jgi:hypothetical protein
MKVLSHHIYEYKKGLRNLVLQTMHASLIDAAIYKLDYNNIPYFIQEVTPEKINLFFGDEDCIEVVKHFKKKLSEFTPEQDFILGIMLGYGRAQQCSRYLERTGKLLSAKTDKIYVY